MSSSDERVGRWLGRRPMPESAALLFTIPYSGCGASMYRDWPRFAHGVELCPVQLPGRESRIREPVAETYEALAEALVTGLEPYLDRPFGFFGHCGSALIGYQAALELRRRGGPAPTQVFVSSQVAPQDGPYGRFLSLDRDGLRGEVMSLMRATGGLPVPDVVELCLDVLCADVAANARYRPGSTRVDCPITAVGWRQDVEVEPWRMSGWARCGATSWTVLEGGHHAFLDPSEQLLSLFAAGLGGGAATLVNQMEAIA